MCYYSYGMYIVSLYSIYTCKHRLFRIENIKTHLLYLISRRKIHKLQIFIIIGGGMTHTHTLTPS